MPTPYASSEDPHSGHDAGGPTASGPGGTAPGSPADALQPPPPSPEGGVAGPSQPETILWSGRRHWTSFPGTMGCACLVLAIAWTILRYAMKGQGFFSIVLAGFGIGVAVFLVTAAVILFRVLSARYKLTRERLFIERGILSLTIDQTELVRVDDVRVRKSLWNRFFGLGTIEVLSTDATDQAIAIPGVRDPDTVAEHVRSSMRVLRQRSLYVESL